MIKQNVAECLANVDTLPQKAIIHFTKNNEPFVFKVSGRFGQTLYWLIKYQDNGITAQNVCNTAYRLASYIYTLRWKYKLDIKMELEPHKGGKHARYWLRTPVTIQEIAIPEWIKQ